MSSDNLKELLDSTDNLMWSVDRDFKLNASKRPFREKAKLFSEKADEAGSDVLSIHLQFMAFYERVFLGETFVEVRHPTDSVELWSEISFFPIRKGDQIIGAACCSRDITISKREEHRLKLLESVVINATDSVLITEAFSLDEKGPKIVYANNALTRMTGYTQEEIIGKTPRMLHGPKTNKEELSRATKCLTESKACEVEIVNYKKNGDEFCMHISIVPVVGSRGLPTYFISIGRDITERFENIKAIKEQNQKLADIAWVQSHDVRGPLARIKGLVNLLSNHSHSEDDTELIGYLMNASNEMDDVIKKISQQTEEVHGFLK